MAADELTKPLGLPSETQAAPHADCRAVAPPLAVAVGLVDLLRRQAANPASRPMSSPASTARDPAQTGSIAAGPGRGFRRRVR